MITHFLRKLRFFVSFTYIKLPVPVIHGLVPGRFQVPLSSRPVPPFYNKGREPDLTKQKLFYFF